MRGLTVLFLLSGVLLCNVAANAQADSSETVLPVTLFNDYLVIVRGSVGGFEKRNLLIDTGANPTVITPELAKKLHLSGYSEQLQAVGHNMNSQVVSLPSLQVGPIQVANLRVLVRDLSEFDRKFGLRVDALVGLDVLAHHSFLIDYHQKRMIFGPVPLLPFAAPIRWTGYMACIDVNVNGQTTPLLLDTGAADVMLFSQRLSWLAKEPGELWATTNLAGHFTVRQVKLHSLEAAGSDLGPREVFVSDSQNTARYPYEGLLALGSPRFRQIAFDFERQSFSWEPRKSRSNILRAVQNGGTPPNSLALASPTTDVEPSRVSGQCIGDSAMGNPPSCEAPAAFARQDGSR
jgi:predicted aspartyl protease